MHRIVLWFVIALVSTASRIFQILDHVGIYMVIAGSYTPYLLISLHHHQSARLLLTAEWVAAILGSTFAGERCCSLPPIDVY